MKSFTSLLNTHKRILGLMLCDTIIVIACAYISMLTRYAPNITNDIIQDTTHGLGRLIVSYIGVFSIFGLYKTHWRHFFVSSFVKQVMGCVVGFGVSFMWDELLSGAAARRYYLCIVLAFTMCGVCCFRIMLKLIRDALTRHQALAPREECHTMCITEMDGDYIMYTINDIPSRCAVSELAFTAVSSGVTDVVISCGGNVDSLVNACITAGCFVKKI